LEVGTVPTGDLSGVLLTFTKSDRSVSSAPEALSGASQPLTPTQARQARCKKLAEARLQSQLPLDD